MHLLSHEVVHSPVYPVCLRKDDPGLQGDRHNKVKGRRDCNKQSSFIHLERDDLLYDVAPGTPPGRHHHLLVQPDGVHDPGGHRVRMQQRRLAAPDAPEHVGRHEERRHDCHGNFLPGEPHHVQFIPETTNALIKLADLAIK